MYVCTGLIKFQSQTTTGTRDFTYLSTFDFSQMNIRTSKKRKIAYTTLDSQEQYPMIWRFLVLPHLTVRNS